MAAEYNCRVGERYTSHCREMQKLRRQVAKWSFSWKGGLTDKEVLTTAGCISAVSYCLMALTKRGDSIAVESPCFFGYSTGTKSRIKNT